VGGKVKMTSDNVAEILEGLFSEAEIACDRGFSTVDFEPAFVRLLEFINEHPQCKVVAERRFLVGMVDASLCWELISFCMHSLKFEAVKEEANRLIDPRRPRGWGPLSSIVASFDDDWEDADMYDYYRRPKVCR
jgi:hypothetical protein